jgi:hypothetical protein
MANLLKILILQIMVALMSIQTLTSMSIYPILLEELPREEGPNLWRINSTV